MRIINVNQIFFRFPEEEKEADIFEQTHDMKEWIKTIGYKDISFVKNNWHDYKTTDCEDVWNGKRDLELMFKERGWN